MESIDMQRFGQLVSQLRKKQHMTQRKRRQRAFWLCAAIAAAELAMLTTFSIFLPIYVCGKKYE